MVLKFMRPKILDHYMTHICCNCDMILNLQEATLYP